MRRPSSRARRWGAAVLAMGLFLLWSPPAQADKRLGAAVGPVRLVPLGGTPVGIAGLHSYFGTVSLGSAGDGLLVTDRISLERYLLGLNEVPTDWPMEALKAQAVAARTYALWTLAEPPGGSAAVYGFDICASVECQVFSGADVVATAGGIRWAEAVESTAGQAVLYEGRPILARYHSTSGGQTLDNSQAFPDEGDYPYLRSVPSTTEEASPLYRWTVDFRIPQLQRMLVRAGAWEPGRRRLVSVRSVESSAGFHYPDVILEGEGQSSRMTAQDFREIVGEYGPELFPSLYPSSASTSSGRLPETLPSNRIDVFTKHGLVRVIGRGWGHGVGMSQWGAYGLAQRGATYNDILTHYYSGVTVDRVPDPGSLEVGVDWGEQNVTATGAFSIVDGRGKTLVKRAFGTWRFHWAGPGAVAIDPPQGYGLPLEVGIVNAPKEVEVGESAFVTVALSKPARVRLVTRDAPTGYEDPGVDIKGAGRRRIVWLAPLEPGTYDVRIEASTGPAKRRSEPVRIQVARPEVAVADPPDPEEPAEPDGSVPLLIGAAAVVVLGAFVLLRLTHRDRGGSETPR